MHENAQNGIKKVYIAQILIMLSVLVIIPLLGLIFGLAGLAAGILTLVGLHQAGKDDAGYQLAFKVSIASLIFSVLTTAIKDTWIISTLGDVIDIAVTWLVISTTCRLLLDNGCYEDAEKGQRCWKTYVIAAVLGIIASVLGKLFGAGVLAILLGIVGLIFNLIAYFRYFSFLKNSYQKL